MSEIPASRMMADCTRVNADYERSQRIIDGLRRSEAYPHEVSQPVEVLQTHLNWVLLTGRWAYKIKKPVDLGFADYSTGELRRRGCEAELRLNRRLAPELYESVVRVTGSSEQPEIEGRGPTLEHAVRMRQFPQASLLAVQLKSGQVTAAHLDQWAEDLADFHQRASVAPATGHWGTPSLVLDPVLQITETLRQLALPQDVPVVSHLRSFCRDEFHRHRELIAQRQRLGLVRECHGDLHLGNLLLLNNRITAFDCIEFSEDLRWIDVASEIAFFVMDLEEHQQIAFARRFLNHYLEFSGDYSLLGVLDFYIVYRAIVRATVTQLRLHESNVPPSERRQLEQDYKAYIEEAGRHVRSRSPRLWITCGVSGSGKSTGTAPLIETAGAIRLRSDIERKRLAGLAATDSSHSALGQDLYSPDMSAQTYDRLANLARNGLECGFPVIVDATFLKRQQRERFAELAREMGVEFTILLFDEPIDVLETRIRQRQQTGRDPSEATIEVLHNQLAAFERPGTDEQCQRCGE